MSDIVVRALCFLLIIVSGYLLKRAGVFKKEDAATISRLVLNFLLPCTIIANFENFSLDYSLFVFLLFSFLVNGVLLLTAFFIARGKSAEDKIYYYLALPGFNIGTFTLPFASALIGPAGAVTACIFDTPNAVFCNGLDYAVAGAMAKGQKTRVRDILKPLVKVVPFMTYVIFIILTVIKFPVPKFIYSFTSLSAAATAPCLMLMFGIMLEPEFHKDKMKKVFSVLLARYLVAAIFSLFYYFVLDFSPEVVKAAIIVLFSPISGVATAFSLKLGGDSELMSLATTVSILISLIVIVLLVILL